MFRKSNAFLLLSLLAIAAVASYLLSKPSLVGRVGIDLFYREYAFLKTGWKTFIYIVVIYALLFGGLALAARSRGRNYRTLALLILLAGVAGAVYTYYDFRHTVSHRLLGGRFHLGGYLFWAGWLLIPLYYIWRPHERKTAPPAR